MTVTLTTENDLAFWPTPDDVADDAVYRILEPWHCSGTGVRVLEPSAGEGHLASAIRRHLPDAHITCVEPDGGRVATLRGLSGVPDEVVQVTVEAYLVNVAMAVFSGDWEPFHLVIMNPPFSLPGRPEVWAEHILAIYNDPHVLVSGGTISAIVPRIVMTGRSRLVRSVRDLLHPHFGAEESERGAFAGTGAQVSTALLWIEKP